jgi:effector-binding domain-containing protein
MTTDQIPIGKFSLITRLTQKALRFYDDRGLLVPGAKDSITGYRYYNSSQIARGVTIKTLCVLGFSLDEVSSLIAAKQSGELDKIRALFGKRRSEIRSEVYRLQQLEAILENPDASLELIYMSLAEPVIKEVPPLRAICKRDKGVYSETITRLITELCNQLFCPENQNGGVKITGPVMTIYYDCDYRDKDSDMECAVPIAGKVVVHDPKMEIRTIPRGRKLTLLYKGPYSGLHEAWSRIYACAEEKQYLVTAPGREIYYNSPADVPEEELLTELQVPFADEITKKE